MTVNHESTNPQDREPKLGIKGRVYVSLLDDSLMLKVGDRILFDLSAQDGRDAVDALTIALNTPET